MSEVEAIYRAGVFKPLGAVSLPDNQRVRLLIRPLSQGDVSAWLEQVRRLQCQIIVAGGLFPDSTVDIAADRVRDE